MLKFRFARFAFAVIMIASAGTLVANQALAAQTGPCRIYDVSVDTNATRLTLHCAGDGNHYTVGTPGCGSVNADQIKLWHAQAMAAMLSGKTSFIYYTQCGNDRTINGFLTTMQ
jgi:hypothetical protein